MPEPTYHSLDLNKDDGGWDIGVCACGWTVGPVPGAEIVAESYAEHYLWAFRQDQAATAGATTPMAALITSVDEAKAAAAKVRTPHAFRESVGSRPWFCGECGERESHRTHRAAAGSPETGEPDA